MTAEQLATELNASTSELIESLSRFTPEAATQKVSAEEWSAAEVGEHLLILETIANRVLRGDTIESNRPPDEKMALIERAMLDLDTKRKAPDAVLPSARHGNLSEIIAGLQKQRRLLIEIIETADLNRACIAFKHPGLGTLTMMEWIRFTSLHSRRHVTQLERIFQRHCQ
ncbi:MAG TPA: DinB family protein [Flavisolibacter sp.]|jgi:hypothetical protein|nr:DinB family protein [Flavisolibacter sp.]